MFEKERLGQEACVRGKLFETASDGYALDCGVKVARDSTTGGFGQAEKHIDIPVRAHSDPCDRLAGIVLGNVGGVLAKTPEP